MTLMLGKAYSEGRNAPITIIFPILVIVFAVGSAIHDGTVCSLTTCIYI